MTDTGGPAFPTKNYAAIQPLAEGYSEGMTLRDWFAGMAMQGIDEAQGIARAAIKAVEGEKT